MASSGRRRLLTARHEHSDGQQEHDGLRTGLLENAHLPSPHGSRLIGTLGPVRCRPVPPARQGGEFVLGPLQKGGRFRLAPCRQARQLVAARLVPGEERFFDFINGRFALRGVARPILVLVNLLAQRGAGEVARTDVKRQRNQRIELALGECRRL